MHCVELAMKGTKGKQSDDSYYPYNSQLWLFWHFLSKYSIKCFGQARDWNEQSKRWEEGEARSVTYHVVDMNKSRNQFQVQHKLVEKMITYPSFSLLEFELKPNPTDPSCSDQV